MERGALSENGSLFWPHDQPGGGWGDHGHYHQAHHHYQQHGHLHHQHDEHHHHRIMSQTAEHDQSSGAWRRRRFQTNLTDFGH